MHHTNLVDPGLGPARGRQRHARRRGSVTLAVLAVEGTKIRDRRVAWARGCFSSLRPPLDRPPRWKAGRSAGGTTPP